MTAVPPDAQAVLTIDLGALAANWRLLADRAAPAECGAVVKADAYGIGIEQAVPALARAGCRTFFTAHVAEGMRARDSLRAAGLPDDIRIFILNGYRPEAAPFATYAEWRLGPVLCSLAQMGAFARDAAGMPTMASALHVDTGMNRAGLDPEEALRLVPAEVSAARCTLLMSHFVAAEEPANPVNAAQIAAFAAVAQAPALAGLPASLANSSGLFLDARPFLALVRPGFALYGGNPCPGRPNPMRPVVALRATILQTRWIEAGEAVGYGGRWIATRRSHIATLGVGYADGFFRNAKTVRDGAGPVALVEGIACPLVGRVSMDLTLVDVTDAGPVAEGVTVELLGSSITVDDLGAQTAEARATDRSGRHRAAIRPPAVLSHAAETDRTIRTTWPRHARPSSARTAARSPTDGRGDATPAANGTPSSRKRRRRASAAPSRENSARGGSSRWRDWRPPRLSRRASPPESPNSTA